MTLHNSVELSQTKQCEYTAQLLSCSTVSVDGTDGMVTIYCYNSKMIALTRLDSMMS